MYKALQFWSMLKSDEVLPLL